MRMGTDEAIWIFYKKIDLITFINNIYKLRKFITVKFEWKCYNKVY